MTNQTNRTKYIALGFAALLVVIDQLTKRWAVENLTTGGRRVVVDKLFYLTYVENRGAAFGMFQGQASILSVLTGAVLLALLLYLLSGKVKERGLTWLLSIILAGGVGNLIDRVRQGYVVDFLDFSALFDFPVFNFADCCVVVGALLLLCYAFWWKDPAASGGEPPLEESTLTEDNDIEPETQEKAAGESESANGGDERAEG